MKITLELSETELYAITAALNNQISKTIENKQCINNDLKKSLINTYNVISDKFHDARLEAVSHKPAFTMHASGKYPDPEHQVSFPEFHDIAD